MLAWFLLLAWGGPPPLAYLEEPVGAVFDAGVAAADDALLERGAQVFRVRGCAGCHSTDGSRSTGPTLRGVAGSQVRLQGGAVVTADEAYLRESILKSGAKIVEGFFPLMPVFKGVLSDAEVDALVAYVQSLGSPTAPP